ncbi:hypothetical protein, variant [Sphaeroforma arctica JP610]|uniref:Phorbol-ester/DAG-type domain-containing protein n=1 Tax=Sphaeroforma arctica JP610 TaxID=667725 RepID=A0A0L0FHJ3_9EUKA|nr:hypothetical protein, variant [Sphaeroforma arctica JP610]KNC76220.1 hypothetical protein, variant [Sphaeroforma arctica JP610]|eukprot:XP_014150122.1 hypothetical protein, variant [Sphaeroforma arctica JP610]
MCVWVGGCSGCNWNVHKSCRAKIPDNCVHRSVPSGEADEGGKKKGGSLQLVGPTAVRRASRRASRRIQGSSSGNSINGVVLLHVLYTQPPLRGIPGIGMILTECNEWEPELRRLHSLGLGGDIQVNCQLLAENDGDPLAVAKVLSAV